jgi:hypothetical protein
MSTALALASVTAILKDLLNNGLIDHDVSSSVGNILVTALPPDRIETGEASEKSQLNLFLYQVTPNPGWRNVALPSRNANGDRLTNPPLALDLHYMLTAYGAKDLHGEILLGYGMQLLHETPVLTRNAIRRSLGPTSPVNGSFPAELANLATAGLAEQVEQIKICPMALTSEEISRLWTAFQARYRPTAAYQVSVVLIESRQSVRTPLPVRSRAIYVAPSQNPHIVRILSQSSPAAPIMADQPILTGFTLVIDGTDLRSEETLVSLSGLTFPTVPANVTPERITLVFPSSLRAGVIPVQVVHRVELETLPEPPIGTGVRKLVQPVTSNVAAFVLRPRILSTTLNGVQTGPLGLRSATLHIEIEPEVGDEQRVVGILNELNPPGGRDAQTYAFAALPRDTLSPPDSSPFVDVPIADVEPGAYLLRVQVDGAESPLDVDANGRFVAPQVTI